MIIDFEFITRGGKVPFILALDVNASPEAWAQFKWGDQELLEHMDAEIVLVNDNPFTCVGGTKSDAGSNIDYFI